MLVKKRYFIALLRDLVRISKALVSIVNEEGCTYDFDEEVSRAEAILKAYNQEVQMSKFRSLTACHHYLFKITVAVLPGISEEKKIRIDAVHENQAWCFLLESLDLEEWPPVSKIELFVEVVE